MSAKPTSQSGVSIAALVIALAISFLTTSAAAGPPKAVGYRDALRVHQLTTYSSDWSDTRAFDIENPIAFPAIVTGLEMPEKTGYAILEFKLDIPPEKRDEVPIDPDVTYRATLQLADEVRRLNSPTGQLRRGVHVTLKGWPRTENSFYSTMMLVDELTITGNGNRLGFHDENTKLREREERAKNAPPEGDE